MWIPPWVAPAPSVAFGALPEDHPDRALARETAARVRANIDAGRPFYADVPEAFRAKFQENAGGIYRYLVHHWRYMPRTLRNGQAASEDDQSNIAVMIVNKTYYNALRGISGYRGDGPLRTWFYAIARDALIDELRMTLRSPEVRRRMTTTRLDDDTESGSMRSAVVEYEVASSRAGAQAHTGALDDREEAARRAEMLAKMRDSLRQLAKRGRDRAGQPYLTLEELRVLEAAAGADNDLDRSADSLGRSRFGFRTMHNATVQKVSRAVQSLRARGK